MRSLLTSVQWRLIAALPKMAQAAHHDQLREAFETHLEETKGHLKRVKEAVELSIIDQRKFRFMVDEVPNFATYIMGAMARRIRGMSQAM